MLPPMLGVTAAAAAAAAMHRRILSKCTVAACPAACWQAPDPRLALDECAGLGGALDGDNVHGGLRTELLELVLHDRVALQGARDERRS